jgi:RNA polymerase sigma factor (sigma-70 family)
LYDEAAKPRKGLLRPDTIMLDTLAPVQEPLSMADTQLRTFVRSLGELCSTDRHGSKTDGELLSAFLSRRDQAAFAALVQRHGPMVLGVCRRVLHQAEDAEDCFQATFLLLARKAAAVHKCESLGSWLHGVAYRMATNSHRAAARRRTHEARATPTQPPNPAWQAAWREVQAVLDEEIQRLPAAYREAFVLCCLEGRGCGEVARERGLKEGTLWSRAARARERLRARLAQRGVSLTLVLAAAALSGNTALAAVPPSLLRTTAQCAAGQLPTLVSPRVAALLAGGMKAMFWSKLERTLTALLALALLAGAAGAVALQVGAAQPGQDPPAASAESAVAPPGAGPKLTDRYGDPLPPGALARMGTTRFRPGNSMERVVFSPDGKLLASFGWNHVICVWEAVSGKEVRRIACNRAGADLLEFWDNGRAIAAGGDTGLRVWDIVSGKERDSILADLRQYNALSADGKTLVSAHFKGEELCLFDIARGVQTHTLPAQGVVAVCISPDGKTVAAAGIDNIIRLWDAACGQELRKLDARLVHTDGDIVSLAFSPDGQTLAAALVNQVIRLWDVPTGKEHKPLEGHSDKVLTLAFAPDGKTLASGGRDKTVRLWDLARGKELFHATGHQSWVMSIAFSPDGRTLASGAQDGTVRRWDATTGKELSPPAGHDYWIFCAALSPDGKLLATGAGDGTIRFWRTATGEELRRIDTAQGWVQSLAFAPDGKTLASAGWDKTIRLWDPATGAESRRLQGHRGSVNKVAFSPDGKLLASVADDANARLWDPATGRELAKLPAPMGPASAVAFSPDGKRLATAEKQGGVRVWDVAARREVLRFKGPQAQMHAVAFSPNGKTLAVAGYVSARTTEQLGDAMQLWDVSTGKEIRRFSREPRQEKTKAMTVAAGGKVIAVEEFPGPRWAAAVAFTPDGRKLISAENDGTVVVWEVLTGLPRREFIGHQAWAQGLAVSADGRVAASVSMDLTALVWDVTGLLQDERQPGRFSAGRLQELWDALSGPDCPKATQAALALTASPGQTVELLKRELLTSPQAAQARLGPLIADLDNDQFAARERAERELGRLGRVAEPALRNALEASPSAERRRRIQLLLEALQAAPAQAVVASRAVEVLEWLGTPEALRLLEEFASGTPGAALTEEATAARRRLLLEPGTRR